MALVSEAISKPLSNRNAEWARVTMRMLIEQMQIESGSRDVADLVDSAQDRLFALLVLSPLVSLDELTAGLEAAQQDVAFLAYEHDLRPSVMQ
ncbi:hypothetical protein [uncultured Sulfitobacter sp.]|uniref:hypothetical protein n=1 Tax=uncultured Sulfitobacter sp. TaxID=191468 RepID=UPI002604C111|nr:hypothetical protein [uncultured Sulfitobacter sp.]